MENHRPHSALQQIFEQQSEQTKPLAAAAKAQKWLCFHLNNEPYVIELLKLQEILRYPQVVHVPKSLPMLRGILNLRGILMTVVDLAQCVGMKRSSITPKSRILVIAMEKQFFGILVDGVEGVISIPPDSIIDPPQGFSSINRHFILKIAEVAEKTIIIPNLNALSPSKIKENYAVSALSTK